MEKIKVIILDIDLKKAGLMLAETNNEKDPSIFAFKCDVGSESDVQSTFKKIEEQIGYPLILINNAGIGGPFKKLTETTLGEWTQIFDTNLKSVFLLSRILLPRMKEANYGRIVNIASIYGQYGAKLSSTYIASKHGMVGYTKAIASEWGEYGITCNAILPGFIDTQMGIQENQVSDHHKKVLSITPAKKIGQPADVAELVMYLLGPQSSYMNGACLALDGGITSWIGI